MQRITLAVVSLLVASWPGLGLCQPEEKLKIHPIKPKLEILSIEAAECSKLKSQLAAAAVEDTSLCSGQAYTQRPEACIALARKLIALSQAQLMKLSRCPALDANYARAIIANSSNNLRLFEAYAADVERRAAVRSPSRSDSAPPAHSQPRRCWVVSQQCQDCNINGCFPYVCNSRTECD